MPRSDLFLNLAKAGSQGDQVGVRRTLEAIVADERGRQHHVVADRLSELLSSGESEDVSARGPVQTTTSPLLEVAPRLSFQDLVLPPNVRQVSGEVVEEQHRADLLRSHGIEPRSRILLVGEPGNGKTSLAEALAGELSVPLLVVRYEAIVGSYLGETALRLARMFDRVRARRCVLFFDEFDAIGKERGDKHETGEIKRVVSSLLLNVDALPSYVVTVAATNHPELLDRAIWRRFQVRLDLPKPGTREIGKWLVRFEERLGLHLGLQERNVAGKLKGLSYAELDELCADIHRRIVLAGQDPDLKKVVSSRLAQWRARTAVHG